MHYRNEAYRQGNESMHYRNEADRQGNESMHYAPYLYHF